MSRRFTEDPVYMKTMKKFRSNPINVDFCMDIVDLRLQNAFLQIMVEELQADNTQKDAVIATLKSK
jgi:hypothetical protein